MKPIPQFVELKDGPVNAAILDLMERGEADSRAGFEAFEKKYGETGTKQYERVRRQKRTAEQAITLLTQEHGVDPVSGREIRVIGLATEQMTYDNVLNAMLEGAINSRREALQVIDGCLWLYTNADKALPRNQVRDKFIRKLAKAAPHLNASVATPHLPLWDRNRLVCLNDGFTLPMAKPLFLRRLNSKALAHVAVGELMFRTYLYLDWERFGELINGAGGRFGWSSFKQARAARALKPAERPPVVERRVPQVRVGAALASVTDPNLVEMFFDGVTPRTMANLIVESCRSLEERHQDDLSE
jgi:hypothetical protein